MTPRPRFACAACGGLIEETCPCGRVNGAWAYPEQVIVLHRPAPTAPPRLATRDGTAGR